MFDLIFPNLDREKANKCVACEYKKKSEDSDNNKSEDEGYKSD